MASKRKKKKADPMPPTYRPVAYVAKGLCTKETLTQGNTFSFYCPVCSTSCSFILPYGQTPLAFTCPGCDAEYTFAKPATGGFCVHCMEDKCQKHCPFIVDGTHQPDLPGSVSLVRSPDAVIIKCRLCGVNGQIPIRPTDAVWGRQEPALVLLD